jgi:nicotinate-nucleotide pyrophosphorylase
VSIGAITHSARAVDFSFSVRAADPLRSVER